VAGGKSTLTPEGRVWGTAAVAQAAQFIVPDPL
jgi:hypothetical protein